MGLGVQSFQMGQRSAKFSNGSRSAKFSNAQMGQGVQNFQLGKGVHVQMCSVHYVVVHCWASISTKGRKTSVSVNTWNL